MKISFYINRVIPMIYVGLQNKVREVRIGLLPLAVLPWKYWEKYIYWKRYSWIRVIWFGVGMWKVMK